MCCRGRRSKLTIVCLESEKIPFTVTRGTTQSTKEIVEDVTEHAPDSIMNEVDKWVNEKTERVMCYSDSTSIGIGNLETEMDHTETVVVLSDYTSVKNYF